MRVDNENYGQSQECIQYNSCDKIFFGFNQQVLENSVDNKSALVVISLPQEDTDDTYYICAKNEIANDPGTKVKMAIKFFLYVVDYNFLFYVVCFFRPLFFTRENILGLVFRVISLYYHFGFRSS